MENKLLERKQLILTKHKVLSEMGDEELEDLLKEIEEREGVNEGRDIREERAKERAEHISEVKERNLERARLRLNDSDSGEKQRLEIQKRIEEHAEVAHGMNSLDGDDDKSGKLKELVENELEERGN